MPGKFIQIATQFNEANSLKRVSCAISAGIGVGSGHGFVVFVLLEFSQVPKREAYLLALTLLLFRFFGLFGWCLQLIQQLKKRKRFDNWNIPQISTADVQ